MKKLFRHLITVGVAAMTFESFVAPAQAAPEDAFTAPSVPANIQVPVGNTLFFKGQAEGTQNYICLPSSSGFSWTFFSPQATLFLPLNWFGVGIRQQVITHFLSPNPSEKGTPRATWQSSFDTSAVWARSIGSSSDPNFVVSGAVPWLLLEVVGTQRGPAAGSSLAHTTFVQRLTTSGGVTPSGGCSQSGNVGATALVPYTADYLFYKASPK